MIPKGTLPEQEQKSLIMQHATKPEKKTDITSNSLMVIVQCFLMHPFLHRDWIHGQPRMNEIL